MKRRREESYSTLEVARLLGVTVQTVQRWVDAGHLQAWRTVGGHRRIDAGSVTRFREASGELTPSVPRPTESVAGAAPVPATAVSDAAVEAACDVLVVDDDPGEREAMGYLLRRLRPHWRVDYAENGFSALLAIGRRPPRLLITDVVMPYLDGPAMLRTLQQAEAYRDLVILAISSHSAEEVERIGGLPPGVTFLNKPISRAALASFIENSGIESATKSAGGMQ